MYVNDEAYSNNSEIKEKLTQIASGSQTFRTLSVLQGLDQTRTKRGLNGTCFRLSCLYTSKSEKRKKKHLT